eukprot:433282_1
MESLGEQVLYRDTYFGLIAEYFHSIDYAKNLCLLSKYHYEFPKNEQYNYQIMIRILSREFFDIKSMTNLMNINANNIYQCIGILHHFYINIGRDNEHYALSSSMTISKWMKKDFLSRWRYLCGGSYNVQLYGIKYWLTKISQSHKHCINTDTDNTDNNLVTTMILHSNMNGDKNTFNIDSCTELINWSVDYNGYLLQIKEFSRLLVATLDVNQNRKNINHPMFAWSLHYLCLYFENKLDENKIINVGIINVEIVQELSTFIAELIVTLHTANVEHNIYEQKEQMYLFHDALNKYVIQERFKKIWSKIMGGNMISFTAGFTRTVSSFFNCLMLL